MGVFYFSFKGESMYKLYNGDCLEVMDKLIEESVKVDCILTDPPYLIDYKCNRRVVLDKFDKILNDKNSYDLIIESINKAYDILNDNSSIYMFCSWHNIDFFKSEFEKRFKLKNIIVWNKNNHGTGDLKGSYAPKHEFILYGHKGRCLNKSKRLADVISCDKVKSKDMVHSTEKPIELLTKFINMSTNENDIILDCFMGSGSTGVACMNTNRRFIGIELDNNYFNIAKQRIEEACK